VIRPAGRLPHPLVKLLSTDQLETLERHLSARLDDLLLGPKLTDFAPVARLVADHVRLGGGKRLRPQLCCWACSQWGGDPRDPAVLDVACGWELFHAFLLVHDDIIDASARRRGRPSLHRQLASLDHDSSIFGANLGIVAGDLLFAAAMRLWQGVADDEESDDPLPPAVRRRLLRLCGRVALETGAGQAADVTLGQVPVDQADEARILAGYTAKTAAYTFEGPAVSGAILAQASADECDALARFATALGQAYQLHNDLLDLDRPADAGGDLAQGKRTVTLARAYTAADPDVQATMLDDLSAAVDNTGAPALAAAERLRRRLHEGGAVDSTRVLIRRLLDDARRAAFPLKPGVNELLSSLRDSYFA
jgi:geranylgeranyl diphosphate synthase type I